MRFADKMNKLLVKSLKTPNNYAKSPICLDDSENYESASDSPFLNSRQNDSDESIQKTPLQNNTNKMQSNFLNNFLNF